MDIKIKIEYLDHSISLPGRKHNIQMRFLPLEMYDYVRSMFPEMFVDVTSLREIIEGKKEEPSENIEVGMDSMQETIVIDKPKRKKNDKPKDE